MPRENVLSSYNINGGRPMGIVVYRSAQQPSGKSPLHVRNMQMCIVSQMLRSTKLEAS